MKQYVLTYGIACIESRDGKAELITQIPGVTTDLEKAECLVRLCNEQKLSPEHLADAVDDLVAAI